MMGMGKSNCLFVCYSLTLSPSSLHVVEMLEMLMMRRCSCRGVACVHANSVAINVPDPDDPDMDPVYRTESNVIHVRLSSPQRFVVACFATTAAFGLIILLVESKMNWNWTQVRDRSREARVIASCGEACKPGSPRQDHDSLTRPLPLLAFE